MKNEEKAREIANNDALYGEDPDNNSKTDECYIAALEMAQYKDEQLKQQLNSLKDEIQSNLCASSGFNDEYSHGYQDCGMKVMEIIDKILEL